MIEKSRDCSVAIDSSALMPASGLRKAHGIPHAIWTMVESYLAYRVMKSAESQLRFLDDWMLRDMGPHRSEIDGILKDLPQDSWNRSRNRRAPVD